MLPFKIPYTRTIELPAKPSRNVLTIGIPPGYRSFKSKRNMFFFSELALNASHAPQAKPCSQSQRPCHEPKPFRRSRAQGLRNRQSTQQTDLFFQKQPIFDRIREEFN